MAVVEVCERFVSIQGESTWAGLTCFFVRLAGCNLRCGYCDTPQVFEAGTEMPVTELVAEAAAAQCAIIEITGGEPLLQPAFRELAVGLRGSCNKPVLVETNGTQDISIVPEDVITIMDVKCPGSGFPDSLDLANLSRLRPHDEVKFVLSDQSDYEWAKDFITQHDLLPKCHAVHFSPVHEVLEAKQLAEWIVKDGLGVRLGVQLHKVVGVR